MCITRARAPGFYGTRNAARATPTHRLAQGGEIVRGVLREVFPDPNMARRGAER